jgi:hypothetical protein
MLMAGAVPSSHQAEMASPEMAEVLYAALMGRDGEGTQGEVIP